MIQSKAGPPLTITVYLRLPQMKSLEPLILMVHSVLQTCSAGGLRPLWNVSTVSIQSVCIPIALHGTHSLCWHKPGTCTPILLPFVSVVRMIGLMRRQVWMGRASSAHVQGITFSQLILQFIPFHSLSNYLSFYFMRSFLDISYVVANPDSVEKRTCGDISAK